MTFKEAFDQTIAEIMGAPSIITSLTEADKFHRKLIELRVAFLERGIIDMMPHYRGEQKFGWDILPGIFRPPISINDPQKGKDLERKAILEFEEVINYDGTDKLGDIYNRFKYGKEWGLLFQAQHAGIKTTLIDWSPEIISAMYFATEESIDPDIEQSDGQLWYMIAPTEIIWGDDIYNLDPFDMKKICLINPASYITEIEKRIFEYRLYRQKGRFIIPPNADCNIPLNDAKSSISDFIFRLKIPASSKKTIRQELEHRRVTRSYLYADENVKREGLVSQINKKIFQI